MERTAEESPSGWDVGERPTVSMPYLEYPRYVPTNSVCLRDEAQMSLFVPKVAVKSAEHQRLEERNRTGWASDKREIYKPLGAPEDLPGTGPEMRRRKGAEYVKPKVVVPEKSQKKGKEEDLADLAVQLEAGVPVHGEVRQFQYQYYQFELPERLNLVIALRASQGDPDLFVSNEVMTPKQEPSEHTWRGAATGDDEVLITIDHPRYALGTYYIGVYTVSEYSEFEVVALLQEPPTRIVLQDDARRLGNGYSLLSKMVVSSEQRRLQSLYGLQAVDKRASQQPPKDANQLFHQLPAHLQTALSPRNKEAAAAPGAAATGKPEDADGPGRRGSTGAGAKDARGGGGAPPPHGAPAAAPVSRQPVSFLISPYLTNACFGLAVNPQRGSQIASMAAMSGPEPAVGAPGEAAALLARLGSPTDAPRNPWLPSETEPSQQAAVEEMVARAPTDLKPVVMQVRHHALKNDMEAQMRRISDGLEAERSLIAHFKQAAFEKELAEQARLVDAGRALPLSTNAIDTMRAVRQEADAMRARTLKELAEVAEAEASRAAKNAGEKAKRRSMLQRATWLKLGAVHAFGKPLRTSGDEPGGGGRRMSMRRGSFRRGSIDGKKDAAALAAAAAAGHRLSRDAVDGVEHGERSFNRRRSTMRMSHESTGTTGGSSVGSSGVPPIARKVSVRIPNAELGGGGGSGGSGGGDGGLPNIHRGSMANMLAGFRDAKADGGGSADEELSQLSVPYPISLPRLQPGLSSGKGGRRISAAPQPSPVKLGAPPGAASAEPSGGGTAASAAVSAQVRAPQPPQGPRPPKGKLSLRSNKAPVRRVDGAKQPDHGSGAKVNLDSVSFSGVVPAAMA